MVAVETRTQQEVEAKNQALLEKVHQAILEQIEIQILRDLEVLKGRISTAEIEAAEAAKDQIYLRERQKSLGNKT